MEIAEIRPEVSFCQIFDDVGDRKRCLIEGKEVLKAGYMVACGITEEKAGYVLVHALCVQTCDIRGKPHAWRHMSRKMNSLCLAAVKQACLATVSTALLCFSICTMSIFFLAQAKSMT